MYVCIQFQSDVSTYASYKSKDYNIEKKMT